MIRTARQVNDSKPEFVLKKIEDAVKLTGQAPAQLTIACLGISFKADIDDLRESPALDISKQISLMEFKRVLIVEPNINVLPDGFIDDTTELVGLGDAMNSCDLAVLLVDHSSFRDIDPNLLFNKQIVDTRGIWTNLL